MSKIIENAEAVLNAILPGMHDELLRANTSGDRKHALEVCRGIEAIRSLYPVPVVRWEIDGNFKSAAVVTR